MSKIKWLVISQGAVLFGTGLVFPFYIIFIKQVGATFFEFGIAYALFAISSALVHNLAGYLADSFGKPILLAASSWGTAFALVFFPAVTSIEQVYVLQCIMGVFGAFQKTAEKALVSEITTHESRGRQIGSYHAWTALFSGFAVIFAGYTIDIFSLDIIFYAGSLCMFISGFIVLKIKEPAL